MSTMADRKPKRARRSFTEEFKAGAVRLVLDEGKSVGAAARDLDLTESSLRNWVEQARADRGTGQAWRPDEQRARGARAPAEGSARAAHGTGRAKKGHGLLREGPPVKFAWIQAEKAHYPVHKLCRWLARDAERVLRLVQAAGVGARDSAIGTSRSSCRPRSTRASSATAARGFTRICSSSRSASAASG